MDFKVGNTIGPWTIQSIIFIDRIGCIAVVNSPSSPKEYVMKISYSYNEYLNIIKYNLANHNGIKLPSQVQVYGKIGSGHTVLHWYVMEKYDGNCFVGDASLDTDKLIRSTILFLKYLHRTHKVIHGDIKLGNILYKDDSYVVCDYEAIREPETSTLCDEHDYDNYYYYSYGAEYDKPIYSYRFDLQSVGYMLMVIYNDYKLLEFQIKAHKYYNSKARDNFFPILEVLKAKYEMPTKVAEYFKIIEAVDWFCLEPPTEDIYGAILELFGGDA